MAPKTIADLPPLLQAYVRSEAPFPTSHQFSKETILLARQLRKQHFRALQHASPGLQYMEPDYWQLMHGEIANYARTALTPHVVNRWNYVSHHCARLEEIYQHTPTPRAAEWDQLSEGKREQLTNERRRTALRAALQDPRALGEIELYLTGRIFYGMPHWRNHGQ